MVGHSDVGNPARTVTDGAAFHFRRVATEDRPTLGIFGDRQRAAILLHVCLGGRIAIVFMAGRTQGHVGRRGNWIAHRRWVRQLGRQARRERRCLHRRVVHRIITGPDVAGIAAIEVARIDDRAEIALKYGVTPRGDAHRAQADVILTLELLNAIVELYGVAAVASLIEPKPSGATDKLSFSAVAKYAKGKKTLTLEQLATAFKKDVRTVSFELGKAIDERMVDPSIFASQPAQDWLAQALPEVPLEALETGRLTQINAALLTDSPPQDFDYIQLRVGLLAAGLAWGSLKPS